MDRIEYPAGVMSDGSTDGRHRVVLLDAGPTILPAFPESLQHRAARTLESMPAATASSGERFYKHDS